MNILSFIEQCLSFSLHFVSPSPMISLKETKPYIHMTDVFFEMSCLEYQTSYSKPLYLSNL